MEGRATTIRKEIEGVAKNPPQPGPEGLAQTLLSDGEPTSEEIAKRGKRRSLRPLTDETAATSATYERCIPVFAAICGIIHNRAPAKTLGRASLGATSDSVEQS